MVFQFRGGEKSWWKLYRFKITSWKPAVLEKHLSNTHNTLYEYTSLLQNIFQRKSLCPSIFINTCTGEKSSISCSGRKQSISPWVWNSFNKPEIYNSSNFNFPSTLLCWSISWCFAIVLKVYPSQRFNS